MKKIIASIILIYSSFSLASEPPPISTRGNVNVTLTALDCGRIESRQPSMFNPQSSDDNPLKMANTCYLIKHPQGTLMWDAGFDDAIHAVPEGVEAMGGAFHFTLPKTTEAQLAEVNLTFTDIDYFSASHLHFDHIGNANQYAGSKWLVQKPEYDIAFSEKAAELGFDPTMYSDLKGTEIIIEGDHQVFGDGSVVILSAYGHSPGHQVLYVDLPNYGPVVLSGDLYHTRKNRRIRAIPVFNQPMQSKKAFEKIEKIIAEAGAELWIGHDLDEFNQRKLLPYIYR
ncbi:N-acyl homoserine lactonase family protein [Vibrio genomosp. F10]|uniref:N-acyl homoserine lactonase family protein n=1 Tax=Vibrio genomosp. F10 TaxID=723171 RepID=UPI0002E9E7A4|nr:N-acyl homoserine lactonase family protein [Vibrio genomosp. F10]OEF03860.1 AttM/AiiB family protein [Vibrio genomosp. F10 str. 9ZB36]